MSRTPTKSVTVRLPESMYQEAQEIVGATGKSFNELFVLGVQEALKVERESGGDALVVAIEGIRGREKSRM